MILSVSRRTDIPNYYPEWFINRVKEGYLYVRNPINVHQISKIPITPEIVDCIVFWTKNPKNMLPYLDELQEYKYYFQYTITGYGKNVERGIPDKKQEIIPTFIELSKRIGRDKVIWRYDPILLTDKYTLEYHIKAFSSIAEQLKEYTKKVVISFVDLYDKTKRNTKELNMIPMNNDDMRFIATEMAKIACKNGLKIESCAENIDLQDMGIEHGSCIDSKLISQIIGCKLDVGKDKNQRQECGCVESVEVGTYNTCRNGCRYCYANFNDAKAELNSSLYDPNSPLLCGSINSDDKITERKVKSLKRTQLDFFDYL